MKKILKKIVLVNFIITILVTITFDILKSLVLTFSYPLLSSVLNYYLMLSIIISFVIVILALIYIRKNIISYIAFIVLTVVIALTGYFYSYENGFYLTADVAGNVNYQVEVTDFRVNGDKAVVNYEITNNLDEAINVSSTDAMIGNMDEKTDAITGFNASLSGNTTQSYEQSFEYNEAYINFYYNIYSTYVRDQSFLNNLTIKEYNNLLMEKSKNMYQLSLTNMTIDGKDLIFDATISNHSDQDLQVMFKRNSTENPNIISSPFYDIKAGEELVLEDIRFNNYKSYSIYGLNIDNRYLINL